MISAVVIRLLVTCVSLRVIAAKNGAISQKDVMFQIAWKKTMGVNVKNYVSIQRLVLAAKANVTVVKNTAIP